MRIIRTGLIFIGGVVLIGILVMAVRSLTLTSQQLYPAPISAIPVDAAAAAQRLSGAVQIPTISFEDRPDASADQFNALHRYLEQQFPLMHRSLQREVIGNYSLLYRWQGSDPSLKPILLMAHQDVVPIAPGTESNWQHAPFSGDIADGFIWGRGAWDDKGNLLGLCEAVEMLLAQGVTPQRTILIVSGHDEEVGGLRGAKQIAALLKDRGVAPEFVLDEGMLVTEGIIGGIKSNVALIGLAEKGMATFRVTAEGAPGHSSMPPKHSVIGRLALALNRLETHQMPARIDGVAKQSFEALAPEMSGLGRFMLANLAVTEPLVRYQLEQMPTTNAMLRTTTALTVINGGNKANVLPGRADALVNFRLRPGDSAGMVADHIRRTIDDPSMTITPNEETLEASPVAPADGPGYRQVNRTIREIFPDSVVVPGLLVGGTDSRHMELITNAVYRFSPIRAGSQDIARFHGTNERISVSNYADLIRFYYRLIITATTDHAGT